MKFLKPEDLLKRTPKSGIRIKIMSEQEKSEYMKIYNIYRKFYTEYIIEKFNLKKYDSQISESNLKFEVLEEKRLDIYQYFSSDILKYFYVRNNIYVERLSEEHKKFLLEKFEKKDFKYDEKTKEIIKNTYRDIIYEGDIDNKKKATISYGPESAPFFAPKDAIVIGVRYDKAKNIKLFTDNQDGIITKQTEFLFSILNTMNKKFNEASSVPTSIIRYDDYSIIKK